MIQKNKKSIKVNIFYSIIYQILIIILPIITTPYVSRVLGAESVGIYSYNNSIAAYFVMFGFLGIANYGNRKIAQCKEQELELNKSFSEIFFFQLITGTTCLFLYLGYCYLFADDKNASFLEILYVASVIVDLSWVLNGLEEFKVISIYSIVVKIISAISIFVFVKTPNDIYLYITICSGSILLTNIISLVLVRLKGIKIVKCNLKSVFFHSKAIIILFVPILSVSLYKYLNNILLKRFYSLDEVGFYSSAAKLLMVPMALINAIGNVMLPRISNEYSQNRTDNISNYLSKAIVFSVLVSSSMSFGIWGISKEFVPLFFGNGFEKCINIIPIAIFSTFFLGVANVIRTQCLIPQGKDKLYVISIVVAAIINLIVGIPLIYLYSSIGAAISCVINEFVVCLLHVIFVRKNKVLIKSILFSTPFVLFGAIMLLVINCLNLQFGYFVVMIIKILVGAFIYLILSAIYLLLFGKIRSKIVMGINSKSVDSY